MKGISLILLLVLALTGMFACTTPGQPEAAKPGVPSPFISPVPASSEAAGKPAASVGAGQTAESIGETSPIATASSEAKPIDGAADSETGGRKAVFPNTIIVYQREAKNPGDSGKWTIYKTGRIVAGDGIEWQVPEALVKPLFEFVETPGASEKAANCPAGAAECPECAGTPVHTLIVYSEGEVRELVFTPDCPDFAEQLRRVLDEIALGGG